MSLLSSLTNRIFVASARSSCVSHRRRDLPRQHVGHRSGGNRSARRPRRGRLARRPAAAARSSRTSSSRARSSPTCRSSPARRQPTIRRPCSRSPRTTRRRFGADLFVVLGSGDRVLADAGRIRLAPNDDRASWPPPAGRARTARRSAKCPAACVHAVAFALDRDLGTLLVGFSLDRDVRRRHQGGHEQRHRDRRGRTHRRVHARHRQDERARSRPAFRPANFERRLGGEDFIGRVQSRSGPTVGPSEPVALVLRSRTSTCGFLPALRWQIALTGLAAVLVATIVGYAIARTVTRPVRALTGDDARDGRHGRSRRAPCRRAARGTTRTRARWRRRSGSSRARSIAFSARPRSASACRRSGGSRPSSRTRFATR